MKKLLLITAKATMLIYIVALIAMAALLQSCGETKILEPDSVIVTFSEASECGDPGGIKIETGIDYDRDGVIDQVLDSEELCNGEKGDTGETGPAGEKGEPGEQGEPGEPGIIPADELGTETLVGNAIIQNSADLLELRRYREITGQLTIMYVDSLAGVEYLEKVGKLIIRWNNIVSLAKFEKLQEVSKLPEALGTGDVASVFVIQGNCSLEQKDALDFFLGFAPGATPDDIANAVHIYPLDGMNCAK